MNLTPSQQKYLQQVARLVVKAIPDPRQGAVHLAELARARELSDYVLLSIARGRRRHLRKMKVMRVRMRRAGAQHQRDLAHERRR